MIVLREGVATSQITDPYIRDLVALRLEVAPRSWTEFPVF